MKEKIAELLGRDSVSFKILKFLFGPSYNFIVFSIKNFYFRKNAQKAFARFNDAMQQAGCEYWLTFGTLLGAVRENAIIKHDFDIDVAVFDFDFSERVSDALLSKGFRKKYRINIIGPDSFGLEETYEYKNVLIDIYIFHKSDVGNMIFCHDFLDIVWTDRKQTFSTVRRLNLPFEGLTTHTFLGTKVMIPSNYQSYLRAHYGEDFMVPDPKWSTRTSPAAQIVAGASGITV